MTEPIKIRVCDLQKGDTVRIFGREAKVGGVNGVVSFRMLDPFGKYWTKHAYLDKSAKSQEWVELVNRENLPIFSQVGDKSDYENL